MNVALITKKRLKNSSLSAESSKSDGSGNGATSGVPLFLQRAASLSSTAPSAIQRQPLEEEEELLQPKLISTVIQRQPIEEEEEEEEELIQAKLTVGEPGDEYEREADQVADTVMRMPGPPIRRQPIKKSGLQIQAKVASGRTSEVSPNVETRINTLKGGGQPLPQSTRAFFEPRFGRDLNQVLVHTDALTAEVVGSINANAFTLGNHVYFGSGKYRPESHKGKQLIAHELAHVVQQRGTSRNSSSRASTALPVGQLQCESAHWYTPWLQDYTFTPGGMLGYINVEADTVDFFDSGWTRDALGTGLLSAVAGMAGAVLSKQLGLSQLLSLVLGGASAFARGYMGYHMQERVWGRTVQVHNWYGWYRVNVLTGNLKAVKYRGRGPSVRTMVIPYFYQQRVADADGNAVYTHWRHEMTIPGVRLGGDTLPETNLGDFPIVSPAGPGTAYA